MSASAPDPAKSAPPELRRLVATRYVTALREGGLRSPARLFAEVGGARGRGEPHQEIRELLIASAGENLAMGFLAGAVGYDVAARRPVDGAPASLIVAL